MRSIAILPITLLLVSCASGLTEPKDTPMEEKEMPSKEVNYRPDDETVHGYLALPEGEGPFPAIILIHEWWGLNDNVKEFADRFAEEGYIALAVDLYDGKSTETPDEARVLASSVRENMDGAFANLSDAIAFLSGHPMVDESRLGSIGWCFGGGWSYQMAKNDLGVKASVIYYGQFNPEDDLSKMRATVQGHFGEEDTGIPVDDVKAFQAKLATKSGEHQIFIYENAGHAFANEGGERYHEESAEKAWERTMEFLSEHL